MNINGKSLKDLKEMAELQVEEYKDKIKTIDISHPVQYWENECEVDDLNQKIEVLKAFIELVDLMNI